jgi:hypothetical protein
MRSDLADAGIDRDVKFAPLPVRSPVLGSISLALAEQMQTSAVEHEVEGPSRRAAGR